MQYTALLEALGISPSIVAARGLEPCIEASQLESAERGDDGREHLLVHSAAQAWKHMKAAANDDAILIFIVSAFRSIDRQVEIIRRKLNAGQNIQDILCVSAPPGFSEHHTGRAVDIGTAGTPNLQLEFDATPAFAWLQEHAERFGFKLSYPAGNRYGYQYEPWHWCFDPRFAASPRLSADVRSLQQVSVVSGYASGKDRKCCRTITGAPLLARISTLF